MRMFAYKSGKDTFQFVYVVKRQVEDLVSNTKIPLKEGTIVEVEIREVDKGMRRFKAIQKKYKRADRKCREALKDMREVVEAYKSLPAY